MAANPLRRALGAIVLGIAALVAVSTIRVIGDGRAWYEEGMRLAEARDAEGAAAAFEDAAKSYAPGSPYPARALDRLAIMAKAAEMRGQPELALQLWEVARRSVLATRHVWQPNAGLLARAEREIATLRTQRAAERAEPGSAAPLAVPARPRDPSAFGSILLFAGLLAWIAGSVWLCAAPAGEAARRGRRAAWILAAAGTALWMVMAWFAG